MLFGILHGCLVQQKLCETIHSPQCQLLARNTPKHKHLLLGNMQIFFVGGGGGYYQVVVQIVNLESQNQNYWQEMNS